MWGDVWAPKLFMIFGPFGNDLINAMHYLKYLLVPRNLPIKQTGKIE